MSAHHGGGSQVRGVDRGELAGFRQETDASGHKRVSNATTEALERCDLSHIKGECDESSHVHREQ